MVATRLLLVQTHLNALDLKRNLPRENSAEGKAAAIHPQVRVARGSPHLYDRVSTCLSASKGR